MIQLAPIGPHVALFPAVSYDAGQVLLVYSMTVGELVLQRYAPTLGPPLETVMLEARDTMHGYARVDGEWCIYKVDAGDGGLAILRNLDTGERRELGSCTGNHPVALEAMHHAHQWQQGAAWIAAVEGPEGVRQFPGSPEGIAYLTPDGTPVLWQDNRFSEPGMICPSRAGALTVGFAPDGVLCRTADRQVLLWAGLDTKDLDACEIPGGWAVTAWTPQEGVLLVVLTPEDLEPIPPPPVAEIAIALDVAEGPAPLIVTGRLLRIAYARTWRWGKGYAGAEELTVDPPIEGTTHLFVFETPGRYEVDAWAQPVPEAGTALVYAGRQLVTVTAPVPPEPPAPVGLRRGVQTGFGVPIVTPDDHVYHELATRGWFLARVAAAQDEATTAAILEEVERGPLEPFVIVDEQTIHTMPPRPGRPLKGEFYNEPDLVPGLTPEVYAARFVEALPVARARDVELHTGGISNPSAGALAWLRAVLAQLPENTPVCYHRYSQNPWDVATVPRDGYRNRAAEFAALRAVTGRRRLVCTEFGWKQDRVRQGWWLFGR